MVFGVSEIVWPDSTDSDAPVNRSHWKNDCVSPHQPFHTRTMGTVHSAWMLFYMFWRCISIEKVTSWSMYIVYLWYDIYYRFIEDVSHLWSVNARCAIWSHVHPSKISQKQHETTKDCLVGQTRLWMSVQLWSFPGTSASQNETYVSSRVSPVRVAEAILLGICVLTCDHLWSRVTLLKTFLKPQPLV